MASPQPQLRRLGPHLVIPQRPLAIVLHLLHQLVTGRVREDGEPVDVRARLGKEGTQPQVSRVAPPHPPRLQGPLQNPTQPRPLTWPMPCPTPPSVSSPRVPTSVSMEQGLRQLLNEKEAELKLALLIQGRRAASTGPGKGPSDGGSRGPQAPEAAKKHSLLTPGSQPTVEARFRDIFLVLARAPEAPTGPAGSTNSILLPTLVPQAPPGHRKVPPLPVQASWFRPSALPALRQVWDVKPAALFPGVPVLTVSTSFPARALV